MPQDLTVQTPDGKLNIRVAAWIEQGVKLLVREFPDGTISLPGGRVKFGEASLDAAIREVHEETGEQLRNARLFTIIENFFSYNQPYHEILFIYTGNLPYKALYEGIDQTNQKIYWLEQSQVNRLKPDMLSKLVNQKNRNEILHLINRDC